MPLRFSPSIAARPSQGHRRKRLRPLVTAAACLAVLGATAGPAAAAIHSEVGDAGQTRVTAQAVATDSPTAIRGNVAPSTADMYRVCAAGGAWSAATSDTRSSDEAVQWDDDPMLWLFNAAGDRVAFNDDFRGHNTLESSMSGDVDAGTYYLAIAQFDYGYDVDFADSWPSEDYWWATALEYTINLEGFRPCDVDAPHITTSATTADGEPYTAGDWTNQDVTVAYACVDNDGGSGVDETASTLIASETVSDEGQRSVASSGTCADNEGNTAESVTFGTVKLDKTRPAISASATTADGAQYAADSWTKQNVSVAFACADGDGGSGIDASASDLTAAQTVSDDGEHSVASAGTCADNAGNTAAAASFGPVKIDKTGPVLAFTGERTYTVDEQIQIGCSATDALSGVAAQCTGLSAPAHTYAPGTHTITRSATDNVGNQTTASATFTVKVTPNSVCALTKQYVQGSTKYAALSPSGRKVPDALVATACQPLAAIGPGTSPPAKAALVLTYKVTVGVMTYGGWLNAEQASELKTLAGTL
jgi:hypothetical protein